MIDDIFNTEFAAFAASWEKAGLNKDLLSVNYQKLRAATSASSSDWGLCGDGTLVQHINKLIVVGLRIAKMFSNTFPVKEETLIKVMLLHQIEKMDMFIPNDNVWEIEKRGIKYKFANLPGVVKCGTRSFLWAIDNGIKFTPEEYEAMTIMDKAPEEYSRAKPNLSFLSIIVSTANDFVGALEFQYNKQQKK